MKKIEDYIHLYIGCEVMFCAIEGVPYKCKLVGVTTDSEGAHRIQLAEIEDDGELGSIFWDHLEFIDPILRPLDSMTEEEAIELLCLTVPTTYVDVKKGGIAYGTEEAGVEYLFFASIDASRFKWLLSKGFDLFGLITDGLALNRNTI
jgi:hypothetical protein